MGREGLGGETMTAKEYLNRVRKQNLIVRQVKKELVEVKSDILTLQAASLSEKVSGTKESDLADKYIKLEKYLSKVVEEMDKLIDMRVEAKSMIAMLPDSRQRAILYARYINCQKWEDIASDTDLSWKSVFRIHKKALVLFAKVHQDLLLHKLL